MTVDHNIIQKGCAAALYLDEYANPRLINNVYLNRSGPGMPALNAGNVLTNDPGFANPGGGDFHLSEASPLSPAINAGLTPDELVLYGLVAPAEDLDGPVLGRRIGERYDIGAYESSIDGSTLTVTSAADAGPGSLRETIAQANALPGFQHIKFDLPGACPQVIALQSPLPNITDSAWIDGYSQPGASANTAPVINNAEICVLLTSASTTVPLASALKVWSSAPANLSLTVSGLGFGGVDGTVGFSHAIDLRGGRGHFIEGNAFGGTAPTTGQSLGSNSRGVFVADNAEGVQIGGVGLAQRNTFGATTLDAIQLAGGSGHRVLNNYIGLSANGLSAQPIGGSGVAVTSPSAHIEGNVITAANTAGISVSGFASTGCVIESNTIGKGPLLQSAASFSNGVGILFKNQARYGSIGTLQSPGNNIIANNRHQGIWIDPTALAGTSIRGNRIYGNGTDDQPDQQMAIDIGSAGLNANDGPGDVDSGSNDLQNAPTLTAITTATDGASPHLTGELISSYGKTYVIDLYRSDNCPGGSIGGEAQTYIGSFYVATDPGTGLAAFDLPIDDGQGWLTAIATDTTTQSSSELGNCLWQQRDRLFSDGFDLE